MDVGSQANGDYDEGVKAVNRELDAMLPVSQFLAMDAWLARQASRPIHKLLAHGAGYGRLHELMNGSLLSPGLSFDTNTTSTEWRPWFELLQHGRFSLMSLAELAPRSFMVDLPYISLLETSIAQHGATWLHHLHLAVALMQQQGNESQPARVHLDASVTMNPRNVLGLHLQGNDSAAWSILQDVTPLQGHALDVARDITGSLCDSLRAGKEWAELDGVVASVLSLHDSAATARLMKAQPLRIAQAALAMYHRKDPHRAVALLTAEEGWAVSTRDLVPIWEDAQYAIAEATLARPLNLLDRARVRRAHPPPISIDFNGAT